MARVGAMWLLLLAWSPHASGQTTPPKPGLVITPYEPTTSTEPNTTDAPAFSLSIITSPPTASPMCPKIEPFTGSIYLQTEPWSFLRTMNIMQKSMGGLIINGTIQNSTNDDKVGVVSSNLLSWTVEFELRDPASNQVVSKIVNPGFFWETTQNIYNCKGGFLGSITYDFNFQTWWANLINNTYATRRVLDPQGKHVANLIQEQGTKENGNFLSMQHNIYLSSTEGTPLAAMRHSSGGWQLGPLGEFADVEIKLGMPSGMGPSPAMDPEFLSLVFANVLASSGVFGPGVGLILFGVVLLTVSGCCFACLCRTFCPCCKGKAEASKVLEETEGLLSTKVASEEQVEPKARDIWACCSRRGGPTEQKVAAVAPVH